MWPRRPACRIDLSTDALHADREALAGRAEAVGADPWDWVFGGGEDHALVAAFAGRGSRRAGG